MRAGPHGPEMLTTFTGTKFIHPKSPALCFSSLGCQPQRDPRDTRECDFSRRWNRKKEQHINNNKKQQNTPNTVLRSTSILAQWCCRKRLLLSLSLHLPLAPIGCLCLALVRYDLLTLHTHTRQKLRQLQQRFPLLQRDVWKPMAPKKLVN